jgi:hypothetical protein
MSEKPTSPSTAWNGLQLLLEIQYEDDVEQMSCVIVPDAQADYRAGLIGESTPLAKAVLGQRIGSRIPYRQGDARWLRILAIKETADVPGEEVAARRQEELRRSMEQIERTNAINFASSFSGKWGDYDPQGVEKWDETQESAAGSEQTDPPAAEDV